MMGCVEMRMRDTLFMAKFLEAEKPRI